MDLGKFLLQGVTIPNPMLKKQGLSKKEKALLPKTVVSNNIANAYDYGSDVGNILSKKNYNLNHLDVDTLIKRGIAPNPVNTQEELDKIAAMNQSHLSQFGNFLVQAVGNEMLLGTIRGASDLFQYATDNFIKYDSPYTNQFTEYIEGLQENLKEYAPIIRENPNKPFDTHDFAWWMDNAVSIASTVSLAIPGGGVAKGASYLSRLLNVNKATANILKTISRSGKLFNPYRATVVGGDIAETGIHSFLMRTTENYMEARDTHEEIKKNTLDALKNMTKEQRDEFNKRNPKYANLTNEDIANLMAKEGADQVFKDDLWLLLFDFFQLKAAGKLWKGISKNIPSTFATREAERKLQATLNKTDFKPKTGFAKFLDKAVHTDYKILATEASEGLEEMWQYTTQQTASDIAKNKLDPNQVIRGYDELLGDPHSLEAGFWGWLGGLAFQGLSTGGAKAFAKWDDYKWEQEHKNDPDIIKNFNLRRAEKVNEVRRIQEIESRALMFQNYNNNMDIINRGFNPYETINTSDGIQYATLRDETEKNSLKKITTDNFLAELVANASDRGNMEGLKAMVDNTSVFKELSDYLPVEDEHREKYLRDRFDYIYDKYQYEIGNVANSSVSPYAVRTIALKNVKDKLIGEYFRNEHNQSKASFNNAVSDKFKNDQDKQNKINTAYEEYRNIAIQSKIANIKAKMNNERNALIKKEYQRQINALEKLIPRDINNNPILITDLNDNTALNTLNSADSSIAELATESIANELYAVESESSAYNTSKEIQEASKYYSNLYEAYRQEEYKKAYDTIKRILKRKDINLNDLVDNIDNIENTNLPDEVKTTLKDLFDRLDIYSDINAPVLESIVKLIKDEDNRRKQAAQATVNGEPINRENVPETPNPDVVETGNRRVDDPTSTITSSTGNISQTHVGTEEKLGDQLLTNAERASAPETQAVETQTGETVENPDPETEAFLNAQANNARIDQENLDKQVQIYSKTIASWAGTKDKTYWENTHADQVKNDIIEELKKHTTDQNVIDEIVNKYFIIITPIARKTVEIKGVSGINQLQYYIDELQSRSSNFILTDERKLIYANTADDPTKRKEDVYNTVKEFIESYVKERHILEESLGYSSIESILKYIIHNGLKDPSSIRIYYNAIIEYINNANYKSSKVRIVNNIPYLSDEIILRLIDEVNSVPDGQDYNTITIDAINDSRVNIYTDSFNDAVKRGLLTTDTPIYISRTANGINYSVIDPENKTAIVIGSNIVPTRTEDNTGYYFKSKYGGYNISVYKNGVNYKSNLDSIFETLYDGKESNKEFAERFLRIIEHAQRVGDKIIINYEQSEEDINYIANHENFRLFIDNALSDNYRTGIYAHTPKVIISNIINSFYGVFKYDFSDNRAINLQSYRNYLKRIYSNYNNVYNQVQQLENSNSTAIPYSVTRLSYGTLITSNEPKPIKEAIVNFNSNRFNLNLGVFTGETLTTENGTTTSLKGFGRRITSKGRVGDAPVLLINNGNSSPSVVPLYSTNVNDNETLKIAVATEVTNLLSDYQAGALDFETLYKKLSDLFGINKLISDIRLFKVTDDDGTNDRIILSIPAYYQNTVYSQKANITIFKHNTSTIDIENKVNGGINLYYNAIRDNGAKFGKSSYNWTKEDFGEAVNFLLDYARFAVSREFTQNVVANNNYVSKQTNGKFKVKIGTLFEKEYNSYLDFIIEEGIANIPVGQDNGSNFMSDPDNPKQNRILQISTRPIDTTNVIDNTVESINGQNVYNNADTLLNTDKNETLDIKKFIDTLTPNYRNVLDATVEDISILPDEVFIHVLDEYGNYYNTDAYAEYNLNSDTISITKNLLTHLMNNPTANQRDVITRLIHENIHRQFRNRKDKYNDAERLANEINEFAKQVYDLLFNQDGLSKYYGNVYSQNIRNQYKNIFDVNGFIEGKGFVNDTGEINLVGIEEFITETITNLPLTNILNEFNYDGDINTNKKDSFWTKFLKLIAKLFDIDIKDRSYLAKEISILNSISEEIAPSNIPDVNTQQENNQTNNASAGRRRDRKSESKYREAANGSRANRKHSEVIIPDFSQLVYQLAPADRAEFTRKLYAGEIVLHC